MTLLHEIVFNISGRDLDSAIKYHSADIDRLDWNGRSPLAYAVLHDDIHAARTLLGKGADPNLSNQNYIRRALEGDRPGLLEMLETLFHFGATIHGYARDNAMNSWISWSYRSQTSTSLVIDKILIEHGCDVNHQFDGRTLIRQLCLYNMAETLSKDRIEQLISYGANIELRNFQGYTALHLTILGQSISTLKILLHAGARLDLKTDKGDMVVHLAVLYSTSSEYVKAISEIDLTRLDLYSKNEDGHTAYDLLRKRNGLKWENYFEERRQRLPGYWFWRNESPKAEYEVILALETLLHQIQTSQGIPQDQQYPPLGDYLTDNKDEEPVPGAWPL